MNLRTSSGEQQIFEAYNQGYFSLMGLLYKVFWQGLNVSHTRAHRVFVLHISFLVNYSLHYLPYVVLSCNLHKLIQIYYRIARANLSPDENERPVLTGLRVGRVLCHTFRTDVRYTSLAVHFELEELLRALSNCTRAFDRSYYLFMIRSDMLCLPSLYLRKFDWTIVPSIFQAGNQIE